MARQGEDALWRDGSIRARGMAECRGRLASRRNALSGDAMTLAIGIAAVLILAGLVGPCRDLRASLIVSAVRLRLVSVSLAP